MARDPPDLVILDLMMAGINGAQFLRELRTTHPSLPVVVVTGYPDSDLMAKAMNYGPLLLLAKPVDTAQLTRTVTAVVGGRVACSVPTESQVSLR